MDTAERYNAQIKRREFLRKATLGAAAAASIPAALVSGETHRLAEPHGKLRLSTSSIQYRDLPLEQVCKRIAALGLDAIDVWDGFGGCRHLDDAETRLGPEGFNALLDRHNLKLASISVYQGGYGRYAKFLGDLGGGIAIQGSTQPCKPAEITSKTRAFLQRLKPLVELAEEHNSQLAFENHGNALLDSVDSLKAFVDLNQSKRIGIALAPYHLQARGASVEEAIEICGEQLLFFYAWEQADGIKQLPGHGETDMTAWLAALEKIRYPGYVNPFMHGDLEPRQMDQAIAQSRDYLKKCFSQSLANTTPK